MIFKMDSQHGLKPVILFQMSDQANKGIHWHKSIFNNKCPRCTEGAFWPSSNPYTNFFKNKGAVYTHCDKCGLRYERETGFWYGAMYVSYAIGVAIFVAAWVATNVLLPEGYSFIKQLLMILAAIVILAPVNYYLSRLIWINLFIHYNPEKKDSERVGVPPEKTTR